MTAVVETYELAPGLRDLARHPRRLAARRRPWRDRSRTRASTISSPPSTPASSPSTAPTSIPASRNCIGAMRARLVATRGADAANGLQRSHQARAGPCDSARQSDDADVEAIIDRSLRRLQVERLDLVQFHWWDYAEPRWLDALRWLDDLRRDGQDAAYRRHQFRYERMCATSSRPAFRSPRCRCNIRCSTTGRRTASPRLCRAHGVGLFCYGSVAGGFLSDRWLGAAGAGGAAREPFAGQIQADHRRFRRLGAVSGAAARAAPRRRPARTATSRASRAGSRSIFPASPPSSSARPHACILPPTSRPARSS